MNRDVHARCVKLSLKGKEKAKFIEHVHRDDHVEHIKRHACHYFLELVNNDFPTTDGVLCAGQHEFDFTFTLPEYIPASFYFHEKHHADKPYAVVKYTLKAEIEGTGMAHKQTLIIREKPVPFVVG